MPKRYEKLTRVPGQTEVGLCLSCAIAVYSPSLHCIVTSSEVVSTFIEYVRRIQGK